MDRLANTSDPLIAADERATRMYQRMLSCWAADLLAGSSAIAWPAPDPAADYRNRNWRALYAGSVLDD